MENIEKLKPEFKRLFFLTLNNFAMVAKDYGIKMSMKGHPEKGSAHLYDAHCMHKAACDEGFDAIWMDFIESYKENPQ